jgi:TetR/AcrR family transcriptional repressor of nem operon
MGRPRSFDTATVVSAARDAFVRGGYVGTSVDDLLQATGLQRASLYSAFGSKRGLFIAALRQHVPPVNDLDLLLVALMDVSRDDDEVRGIAARALESLGAAVPEVLGTRVLRRAGLPQSRDEGNEQ